MHVCFRLRTDTARSHSQVVIELTPIIANQVYVHLKTAIYSIHKAVNLIRLSGFLYKLVIIDNL